MHPLQSLFITILAATSLSAIPPAEYHNFTASGRVKPVPPPDSVIQMLGGLRWDFEVEAPNENIVVIDFGFGRDEWESVGMLGHIYPDRRSGTGCDMITICLIPDSSMLLTLEARVKFKVTVAVNGKIEHAGAYFGQYVPSGKLKRGEQYDAASDATMPLTKSGFIRLLSGWESGKDTSDEPDENLLLGFFEKH